MRVVRDLRRQELQGHKAAEFGIFGLVDHTHAAPTQLLGDAVVRDDAANHVRDML